METYARETTDDNIIRPMPIACWINRATGILRIYNTYCFSMVKMVTRKRLNFTFMHTLLVLYTFELCPSVCFAPPICMSQPLIFSGGVSNFTCYCLYHSKARILQVRLKGGWVHSCQNTRRHVFIISVV